MLWFREWSYKTSNSNKLVTTTKKNGAAANSRKNGKFF